MAGSDGLVLTPPSNTSTAAAFRVRDHGQEALQQHLVERIGDSASLARVIEFFEMRKPFNHLIVGTFDLLLSLRHRVVLRESENTHRFSLCAANGSLQQRLYKVCLL